MGLKELTSNSHTAAEATAFMTTVLAGNMPLEIWTEWTYQRALIYHAIESQCREAGYMDDLPGIARTAYLMNDWRCMIQMPDNLATVSYKAETLKYYEYIVALEPHLALAHLYVWHMGDMFGGQQIKKLIAAPHTSLDFTQAPLLIKNLRSKLSDDMADEANTAFAWAIKIMNSYDM